LEFDNGVYDDYLRAVTARKEASMPFKAYALFQVKPSSNYLHILFFSNLRMGWIS
jgi:hypothetical protein